MKTLGLRIYDEKNDVVSVKLKDILKLILNGDSFFWCILWLVAVGDLGEEESMPLFEKKIANSENGIFFSWQEIKTLADKFDQIIEITLIGSKEKKLFNRRVNFNEIYDACDFVIEMIDSSFWEVYSKDENFINSIKKTFLSVEPIELKS